MVFSLLVRKATAACITILLVTFLTLTLSRAGAYTYLRPAQPKPVLALLESPPSYKVTACPEQWTNISPETWNTAKAHTDELLEDKFTIVLQTYQRPLILDTTLRRLLENFVPSLLELHVIWNDEETPIPEDFSSQHGVRVIYHQAVKNSMNEKFRPNPEYRTKAVLLHDDDVYYHSEDMEFAFQTWREYQDRMVGAFARSHFIQDGHWAIDFAQGAYSIVMTGLVFVHVAFLEYWWSETPMMIQIRDYVDIQMNCDDIAMNFLVSAITCQPPLQVTGVKPPVNEAPPVGISTTPEFPKKRVECMNDLPQFFGGMPLINTTWAITRGQFPW
ncbi:unnamed protein product [Clonostachys rosea]|uniref:Glycosyl transferase 64 domain-containing protein n=1 Tax=Bionectria ochroleuca TaxID=29856 RepID=A0ABY6U465_BIOOC|nr:unnamed protein product [Clonostachys rosea]